MSFPNNVTRVAISSYKNVYYDVKPAKMRFTSHENILIHPLLLPVSSQREQTIVISYSFVLHASQRFFHTLQNTKKSKIRLPSPPQKAMKMHTVLHMILNFLIQFM